MINHLTVKNFRRHQQFEVAFKHQNTIISGPNGSGKTSLIEAIYIALSGKSWRSNFEEITRHSAKWWRADLELKDQETRAVKYQNSQKSFLVNGQELKLLPKKQRRQTILFEPSHLNLIFGSPASRRAFFDKLLSDTKPDYAPTLRRFERVLRQRNLLLKNQASRDQLFVWDMQFADLASEIIAARRQLVEKINRSIGREYQKIAGKSDKLKLLYDYYSDQSAKNRQIILNELFNNFSRELATGHTSVGPHQHDIEFTFNSQTAANAISRGENRTIILALKGLEYQMKKADQPLILLDDILSEFDDQHQVNLINSFADHQIIITSVKAPKILKNYREIKI